MRRLIFANPAWLLVMTVACAAVAPQIAYSKETDHVVQIIHHGDTETQRS